MWAGEHFRTFVLQECGAGCPLLARCVGLHIARSARDVSEQGGQSSRKKIRNVLINYSIPHGTDPRFLLCDRKQAHINSPPTHHRNATLRRPPGGQQRRPALRSALTGRSSTRTTDLARGPSKHRDGRQSPFPQISSPPNTQSLPGRRNPHAALPYDITSSDPK